MAHKPPEPEGTTRGRGLFMAINPCLLWFICYICHAANWSLLLLVKLIHMVVFTVNKACKLIYTLNKVVYKKHHFTTSCGIKVTKKFAKRKQAHVGMKSSKTNQTRRERHHNTFTPSLHLVPFCQNCVFVFVF